MKTDGNRIEYTSRDGYTGKIYGEKSLVVEKDGKGIFHTASRNIETIGELKAFVDGFPGFLDMLRFENPKELVAQVGEFKREFMDHFEIIPRWVYCTKRTLKLIEREVKTHYPLYVIGNPSPSIHGMIVRPIDDGEIYIVCERGIASRYRLDITGEGEKP